jgi:hypothetical protein
MLETTEFEVEKNTRINVDSRFLHDRKAVFLFFNDRVQRAMEMKSSARCDGPRKT